MRDLLQMLRADQRSQWEAGRRVLAERYLEQNDALRTNEEAAIDLIYSEILLRIEFGETITADEYAARFPQFAEPIRRQLELELALEAVLCIDTDLHQETLPAMARSQGAPPVPKIPGYDILGQIGRGGRGIVYKARQHSLKRLVALKMLYSDDLDDAQTLKTLKREAEILASLSHVNIVQIFDFGELEGQPYFTMELVEGGNLARRLRAGALSPEYAAALVEQLARGVHAAHEKGIIHRDIKPGNILLTPEGTPKLADFGLAKQLDILTLSNAPGVVGTLRYMAPEQAEGNPVSPATDVHALGIILHEALTGANLFKGVGLFDTLQRIREHEATRLPETLIPHNLDIIRLKCLKKRPEHRYPSALELADDLARFLAGRPITARPAPWYGNAGRFLARHAVALASATLVLLVGALFALIEWRPEAWHEGRYRLAISGTQRQLANHAVDLVGPNVRPLPHRWRMGQGWVTEHPDEPGVIRAGALVPSLLELMPSIRPQAFRIRVELRQDATSNPNAQVGLYFGHTQMSTKTGPVHFSAQFLFADLDKRAERIKLKGGGPGSSAELALVHNYFPKEDAPLYQASFHSPVQYSSGNPHRWPGPRREIILDVEQDLVTVIWEKDTLRLNLNKEAPRWLAYLREDRPYLAQTQVRFNHQGGIGLYLYGTTVSLWRFSVEPRAGE